MMAYLKRLYVTWSVHSFVFVDNEYLIQKILINGFLQLGHTYLNVYCLE